MFNLRLSSWIFVSILCCHIFIYIKITLQSQDLKKLRFSQMSFPPTACKSSIAEDPSRSRQKVSPFEAGFLKSSSIMYSRSCEAYDPLGTTPEGLFPTTDD